MIEIDWRFKGFPPELDGTNVRDIASRNLTVTDFMPPIATIDSAALAANVRAMADYCSAHRVRLAPHAKTAMSYLNCVLPCGCGGTSNPCPSRRWRSPASAAATSVSMPGCPCRR
jgi:hypothetical protein